MLKPARTKKSVRIDIASDISIDDCEAYLRSLDDIIDEEIIVRLASNFRADFFLDLWATILIGSVCRLRRSPLTVIAWGQRDWKNAETFKRSLSGVVALHMSPAVSLQAKSQGNLEFDGSFSYARWVSRRGKVRTIYELDPQSRGLGEISNLQLKDYLLTFLNELDLGYRNRGYLIGENNDLIHILKFLSELHENSYNYARNELSSLGSQSNVRFVRIRSHLAISRRDILKRAQTKALRGYLEKITDESGFQGVIEATVSDFGPGILGHFLSSSRGSFYRDLEPSKVLLQLINRGLTSKSDPGAGLGLPKVVQAARGLKAYVAVRTGGYSLLQDFSDRERKTELEIGRTDLAQAVGTHWQLLWPMIGL